MNPEGDNVVGWKKYPDFGRIAQLRNDGRELLGKEIYWTVKRDGQNVQIYRNKNCDMVLVGSHHQAAASDDIRQKVKATPQYERVVELITDEPDLTFYFEHMSAGRGPCKIEVERKKPFLLLLDAWSEKDECFVNYNRLHQFAKHYKLPVAEVLEVSVFNRMEELFKKRDELLEWCKKHHKEGIVGKVYHKKPQYFFKEKTDLPTIKVPRRKDLNRPELPIMPEEKVFTAIDQARIEVEKNGGDFKNPRDAMPIVAKYVATQGREHNWSIPTNIFKFYQEYLEENGS